MLSPYHFENLTRLVNGDLVLLERKYRVLLYLELWESLIGMCILNCYDKMVIDLGGISYEGRLSTNESSPSSLASEELNTATNTNSSRSDSEEIRNSTEISDSRLDSEEISDSGSLLVRMRRHVTLTPDTVFENQWTSKEYRTFAKQQRQLLIQLTSTNLFGTILFEMNNWQYSHMSPQPSRRVVIRPRNYT